MKKKFIITSVLFAILMTGCNQAPAAPVDEGSATPEEPGEHTQSFILNFNEFEFEGSTVEINDNLGKLEEKLVELTTYTDLNNPLIDSIYVESYVALKRTQCDAETGIANKNVLQVSSSSEQGKITINFNYDIKTVKINAQGYYKAFMCPDYLLEDGEETYVIYSTGDDREFKVNDTTWELAEYTYDEYYYVIEIPTPEDKTIDINSRELVIEDTGYLGRIFINSIEFEVSL